MILASQSAARGALLRGAGIAFEQRPARIDEDAVKAALRDEGPDACALALAGLKAARIRVADRIVIGADQILTCEGEWFDKPPDRDGAREQLLRLRGRSHTLHTAVVCFRDGTEIWRHLERPRLRLRPFSDAFLDDYLAAEGDAVLSSVGAYRLEGPGIQLFEAIEGDWPAILGLPLLALLGFLRQAKALPA